MELGPCREFARMYAQNLRRTTDDDKTKRLLSSELESKLLDNVNDSYDEKDKEDKEDKEDKGDKEDKEDEEDKEDKEDEADKMS